MFLALCMIVTMLPVSAMAEEIHTTIGGSGEIISFAPLTETKKAVSLGTSIEDLELPETLTATVRTAVPADENSTQDSGSPETATPTTAAEPEWEENTVEIPVTWTSPDYDMDTEDEYVFTPVISGYTVSATLPEIKVTVGAAMLIDKTQAREKPTLTAQSEETRDFYIVLVSDSMAPSSLGLLSNDCGLSQISTADSDDYAPDDGTAMVKSYLYRAAVGQTITFHWGLGEEGFRGLLYAYYADDEPTLDATFGKQWAVLRNSGLIGFVSGGNQPIGLQFEVAASPVLSKPDAVTNYDIWVGGVQVTSDNKADVLGAADGEGATVTYDSDTNTLTLNNAAITTSHMVSAANYGIYAPFGLNLKLVGANSIALPHSGSYSVYGIASDERDLQISAEEHGSLAVTAGNNFGIYSNNLTINSGAITTVSSVIFVRESVSISGGTVTSTGGTQGIVGKTITVSGGTVTASGSGKALTNSVGSPDFTGMQVTASLNENGTPVAAYDVANLSTYKYIKVEPGATPPVLSEVGDRTALQSAITDAAGDLDLKLSDSFSYSDTGTIIIDCDYNITIDLNGKTLDGGSLPAIRHQGTGTLTIIDSKGGGIITGKTISGTIRVNNGGTVNINGGTVNATAGTNNIAMWVGFNSILNINGGTVSATGLAGNAIYTQNATLNITGGTISATGNDGYAIYSEVGSSQLLNISGGTISAAGTPRGIAIFNQNTAIKTGKTIIIQGRTKAMEYAPTLDGGVQVMARTNYDGSGSGDYNSESIATYKYLKFGLDIIPPELSSGSVDRTSDTAATIGFTTDKAGTAYYLVVNSGASAPTSMAVKAGTSLGSVSGTVTGKAVTLTAGAKDIYVVVEDSAGNISTPLKIEAAVYVAPPVLSAGNVQRASDTAATIGFTTDKAGTAYYLVVNSGATPPPAPMGVKVAGTSLGSVSGAVAGKAVTLTAGAKDIYVVVEDSANNISTPLKIPAAAYVPPVLSAGSVNRTSDTAATIGFTTDKAGTAYYLVVNSGASAPTNAEVAWGGGFLGFVSGTVTGKAVTLTAGAKDIYVVVFDLAGNISAPLKIEAAAYVAPDTTAPTVTSVSVPPEGDYSNGHTLNFTVNFDENVTVDTTNGTPYIALTVGSITKQTVYVSGSGTQNLVFRYTVNVGDSDSDGVSIGSLTLNGGTIQDAAGNNANLTLNDVNSTAGIRVNPPVAPTITSQPSPQTVNEGQSANFSVTATGTGLTFQWQVNTGSGFTNISNGGVYSGANTSTLIVTGVTAGMNGYQYRAVVSGTVMPDATSNSATLTITDTRTELTSVFISDTTPTFGDILSATINPSTATVTYSWKADGSQVGTSATYEVKAADIGKTITLTVTGTGAYKGTVTSSVTSAVAAKDYSVTVDSTKSVVQGSGLSALPTANAGAVNGTLTWYSDSGRTKAVTDQNVRALVVDSVVTVYWSFTATTAGYVTTPKTGECVVTIASGAAQTLSFAESTVTKTVGDPIFTNVLTHSVGSGTVTYSSSNTSVATVQPTTGEVAIVGAGTTIITANAARVPGVYAPGSASFTLTVNNAPIKTVSVGSQSGTATAGTAGSLTYPVTTANIANGIYAVSVANLPAGVTVGNSGNVTISGNSGTLTLTVADTAPAGTTGTLVLTLDGATSAAFSIVIGEPAPATYTIKADPTSMNFSSLTEGYTTPAAQTVTITNTGNSSVTLTQPTGTNYTIGALSTTTLAANGTATFTVAPKAGLAVGTHNETLTVSTDHSTNATVDLSFTVTAAPTYTITANPTSKNFGSLSVGYSIPAAQSVTITNTGNSSVTLTQSTSTNYTIGALSTTTLAAGGTATFTITPKTGLEVGNYDETLTVSTDHSTSATVNLSFSVTAAPDYTVTFNPNGGTVSETSRSVAPGTAVGALPTPTRSGSYSFDGWYTAASGGAQISASTTVNANVTYYAHWTYTGSTGGTGSDGDDGGSAASTPATRHTSPNVDGGTGALLQHIITVEAAALEWTNNAAILHTQNAASIDPATLQALAQTGRDVVLHADTMQGSAVQGRLYVEPDKLVNAQQPLKLGVYTEPAKTSAITDLFENHFNNKVVTIHMEQQGSLGARLEVAARADLSALDTKTLYFYAYDKATNFYTQIWNPAYWTDSNGYLHFYTRLGGDIIVTDAPLALKS